MIRPATPYWLSKAAWDITTSHRLPFIDGTRAIAIIAVIGFDAHIPGFGGGFVGVDMFFVISGFLITRQIVSRLLAGQFSVTEFYSRRILRIFPPLLLVTVVTMGIAMLFPLLPHESRELAESGAATVAMISNYYFSSGGDYFSPQAEINPLLHTWSLGVIVQYYLVAPAFLGGIVWLAAHRNWNVMRALFVGSMAIVAVSHITLAILSIEDYRLAFFSIMTRAWQFAAGGLLALAVLKEEPIDHPLRPAFGILGVLGFAAAVFFYHKHMMYPGPLTALLPTAGALLLLMGGIGNERALLTRLLASPPAVAVGVLSYSWYLWHWPLIELLRSLPIGQDSFWKDVASSSAALLLSIPTYFLLERPMKMLRRPALIGPYASRIVAAGLGGSFLIAVLALLLARAPIYQRTLQAVSSGAPAESVTPCKGGPPELRHIKSCWVGAAAVPNVLVMGDSHALMLKPAVEWSATAAEKSAIILGLPICPPLQGVGVTYSERSVCANSNADVLQWYETLRSHQITGVVLAARWSFYNGKDSPSGEAVLPRLGWIDGSSRRSDFATTVGEGLAGLIATLGPEMRVLIVGPVPEFKHPVKDCLERVQLTGQPNDWCAIGRGDMELRHRQTWQVLHSVASKFSNVRLIDPAAVFCDLETCRPFGVKGLFYVDKDQLSVLGVEMMYHHFARDFSWVYDKEPAK